MSAGIIATQYGEILTKAAALRDLADRIESNPFTVTLSSSKGAFAEEFNSAINELNNINSAMVALCNATAAQVENMCTQFAGADEAASTMFSGGG